MVFLVENIDADYERVLKWEDLRVSENVSLMSSSLPIITLCLLYLLFVCDIGPSFMKNRPPYDLNKIIIKYNLAQIIMNSVGAVWCCFYLFDVNIFCTPVDKPNLSTLHSWYFILKSLDLLETVFFVLRKKFCQITFLHLYHHLWMFFGTWATCKYLPGGQLFFVGFFNVIVHAVMYLYYLFTALDPHYKKSVWWKKHITQIQICQHCLIFTSLALALFNPTCSYPKGLLVLYLFQTFVILYLFLEFYVKAYLWNSKKVK